MQLRPILIAAVALTLAGGNACDSNVEEDRETSRYVPKVTGGSSEASRGPTRPPQRSDNASTRGEKIEEAHRTSPEDNSQARDKDVASKTTK
jgi:hypothetical protein